MSVIEPASPRDLAAIFTLLERCGLPLAGLEEILNRAGHRLARHSPLRGVDERLSGLGTSNGPLPSSKGAALLAGEASASFWRELRLSYQERRDERGDDSMTMTEQVWDTFHTPLQQFIRRRVSDETLAEDILQDVFLKIHQHVDVLRDVKKLESWIYQITRHAIIDAYRSNRPTTPLDAEEALDLSEELPDDDIVSELLPFVRAMVRSLPEVDRQALVLTEYQGLTQRELAERLGLSFSGAKSRVQRAREKLKQQLLKCCHFELDRRGHIIDYQPRCQCCETAACCAEEPLVPTRSRERASFSEPSRLYEQNR